ncbi:DUF3048 domain-containing protein [Lacrimispora sp. NSJ-141]|uniref:DUF3048 domain-containing protein n=1 Tax=Lientehia hominis TaxID=2897778 RepID=A0AAP2RGW0_9FIRM|nr:DUF3048 domain-containing protein [Lientehia hominis]MCD2491028.1 DUF3048 domain-containing protein [Lientehia hominis]
MKKRPMVFAALALLLVLLSSCGKQADETLPVTEISSETEAVKETTEEENETAEEEMEETLPEGLCRSYLTGKVVSEAIGRRRPIAVMLSNVRAAVPQSGIGKADVIYEAPTEGNTVRLMGIFEDWDSLDKIGSMRSARTYYVLLQHEFNPIFVHYGQCNYALDYIDTDNCDNLNGVLGIGETVFYRTDDRPKPHNAYASAAGITAGAEKMGYSWQYAEDYTGHYQFVKDGEVPELTGASAANFVKPGYSSNTPLFTYDSESGEYYRSQYGEPQIDDTTGEQLSCRNILFQYCEYEHYYDTEYLYIYVMGEGAGKYITDGKAIDVTWKKDGDWGITRYYDTNGNEIKLNQGKTWVCIIQTEKAENVEIYE